MDRRTDRVVLCVVSCTILALQRRDSESATRAYLDMQVLYAYSTQPCQRITTGWVAISQRYKLYSSACTGTDGVVPCIVSSYSLSFAGMRQRVGDSGLPRHAGLVRLLNCNASRQVGSLPLANNVKHSSSILYLIFGRTGTADIRCLRTHYIHAVYIYLT